MTDRQEAEQEAASREELRQLLGVLGWSQRRAAAELGTYHPTISRWVTGTHPVNPYALAALRARASLEQERRENESLRKRALEAEERASKQAELLRLAREAMSQTAGHA